MIPRGDARAFLLLLAAGWSPPAAVAAAGSAKPHFIVTFNGPAHNCQVASNDGSVSPSMPCSKVLLYVVNDLKLPKGSYFDWRTITDVDEHEFADTLKGLKVAGFLPTPGTHVNFITEPHSTHDH